jgi:hypothetical protein
VFLERNRRALECGKVRITFLVRKRLPDVPTQNLNTPRGALLVSTPEATALDLVGYHEHAGGLDQAATVLSELAEKIDAGKLATAAANAPVPRARVWDLCSSELALARRRKRSRPTYAYTRMSRHPSSRTRRARVRVTKIGSFT